MSEYSKLKMTADKSEGSFVETLQGQTGVGFQEKTHVHKDWWAKTQGYDEAMENLQRGADEREDILEATKNICAINDNGDFKLQLLDGRTFKPTDHALSQFSIRTNVPSSTVIQKLRSQTGSDSQDVDCMVDLANNSLRRVDQDKQFRLRTYTDGTCRAFELISMLRLITDGSLKPSKNFCLVVVSRIGVATRILFSVMCFCPIPLWITDKRTILIMVV